ncbi:hypothetical protein FA95DRAFT_653024 [Auriscalpium vulgare]|uniref:Uncharacterized protein n=1 Tax=Auriscalpium vulgare TaxID=40419 RepID=A0ACB8RCD9_9AGAM|nr:hypothetical protein FA95DRAFT_653024 [Auriscalpium vulgare]
MLSSSTAPSSPCATIRRPSSNHPTSRSRPISFGPRARMPIVIHILTSNVSQLARVLVVSLEGSTCGAAEVRKPRTLVLCFDGTSNEYGTKNTNVVKFYSLLKKDRAEDQLCYYQAGVGTYFKPGAVKPIFRWGAKILDEAFAWYLSEHVLDGYRFLMQNYNTGDKVSRAVSFAYKLYASSTKAKAKLTDGFKQTFSRAVPIEFLGVWDTVASVGLIMSRTLPFVSTNTTIRTFRQALALDEHRALFRPNLYHRPSPDGGPPSILSHVKNLPFDIKHAAQEIGEALEDGEQKLVDAVDKALYGEQDEEDNKPSVEGYTTDVKEVWFAGCHCNVGGGAVSDDTPHALANIPLRWMVRKFVRSQCCLFEDAAFARLDIPMTAGPFFTGLASENGVPVGKVDVAGVTEDAQEEYPRDARDVVQRMDDELKNNRLWWVLEVFFTEYYWQDKANKWITRWGIHRGRGRWVPDGSSFPESVKLRVADKKLKYKPRAQWVKGSEVYVS